MFPLLLRVHDRRMLDSLEDRGHQELDVALLLVVLSPLLTWAAHCQSIHWEEAGFLPQKVGRWHQRQSK